MENPLRRYLREIGSALGLLGHELCLQSENPDRPLAIHGKVLQALDYVVLNLHNLNADLDIWRKEMLAEYGRMDGQNIYDGMDRLDMETTYWAVCRMLNTHFPDNTLYTKISVSTELPEMIRVSRIKNMPLPPDIGAIHKHVEAGNLEGAGRTRYAGEGSFRMIPYGGPSGPQSS